MIIDFHTQFHPDKAIESVGGTRAASEELSAVMDAAGADKSVVLQTVTDEAQHEDALLRAKGLDSRRIISFGSVMPTSVNALEYVWKISDEGLKGIGLYPDLQKFDLGDAKYFPIFDLARACFFIVTIDMSSAARHTGGVGANPRDLARIMTDFPGLKVVVSCLGDLQTARETLEILPGKDGIFVDTAYCADVQPDKGFFGEIIREYGAERVLFGSGYPWSAPSRELQIIRSLDITEKEKSLVLGGNAVRLLGL